MTPPPAWPPPPPERPGLLARLLGRRDPGNALRAIQTLLAQAPSPREISPQAVDALDERFGLDVRRHFHSELQGFYRDFVLGCLQDRRFSEEELDEARHLAALLGLSDEVCGLLQRKVAREVYLRSIRDVMDDGMVDEEERQFLRELQGRLEIPGELAQNMEEVRRRQLRSRGRWQEG
jgi:hypothetical protein